jgi:hypothetical protein
MSNRLTNILALLLLSVMFCTAFFSMTKDSLTYDELAHIVAGYSYLEKRDYRINPEHPPLAKDISAIPLTFLNLNFPTESSNWIQESAPAWWVQFDLGNEFVYESGNNPQQIIFWSRLPMILLLTLLGGLLFLWSRRLGGNAIGLLVLTLFAFSPTLLAHGRLVTTDVAAGLGILVSIFSWIEFLKKPDIKNMIVAGILFGLSLCFKFSLVLLIPFFVIITIAYIISNNKKDKLWEYTSKSIIIGLFSLFFVINPIYSFHVQNYPLDHQIRDTLADLAPGKITIIKDIVIAMAEIPFLTPLAQFFRGVAMTMQRASFGNTVYFLGNISADGWWYYFPIIYLLKVPLSFHLITIMGIIGGLKEKKKNWIKENFTIFSLILFILIYWFLAIIGNLNIGIRHILPTLPLIYIVVAMGIKKLLDSQVANKEMIKKILVILLVLYAGSSLKAFPNYIPYFNELAGGTDNGYKISVDSNYDWGQDFYKLLAFVEERKIEKINLDYFGGENPEYYLGDKYVKFNPKETIEPPKGWIAISLNQLQGGIAKPVQDFDQQIGFYDWTKNYEPVARIGKSIMVYYID